MPEANDHVIEMRESDAHRLVLPTGTSLIVPKHRRFWLHNYTVLPNEHYAPMGAERPDAKLFGDIVLFIGDKPHFRKNVLQAMDNYVGRYRFDPDMETHLARLRSLAVKLRDHSVTNAEINDLRTAISVAHDQYIRFLSHVGCPMPNEYIVSEKVTLRIEHWTAAEPDPETGELDFYAGERLPEGQLDVELIITSIRQVI